MRRQRGFTLVEVIVALLILTMIMTTSLAIFLQRNRRLKQASETILVYQALANEAEIQRRVDFRSLRSGPFQSDTDFLKQLGSFDALVEVSSQSAAVKDVALTIRWSGSRTAVLDLYRVDTGGSNLW